MDIRWIGQRNARLMGLILVLLAGCAAAAPSGVSAAVRSTPAMPLARTHDGLVLGTTRDRVTRFLGIPYAAPPVGALRWKPPQAPAAWSGVRRASSLPPACPQLANSNGPRSDDENCLYLSVYRPARTHPGTRRPVLFWIHGGGLTTGSGNQHDGGLLVRTNHMVVVSINYRLGVFGYLALPSLSAEASDHASGDYGLLDQEAALRWTHDNIAAFGGDPNNVTIAGESAGGYSVCALLASPPARGLFDRAVMESGSCIGQPLSAAETSGTQFAAAAGCTDAATAASCLRAKPAGALLDTTGYPSAMSPTVGGAALPLPPADAVASGKFTHVPLLIGTNHDEGRTFAQGLATVTEQQYVSYVQSTYGSRAAAVLALYPWSAFPSPYTAAYAIGAIWTDSGSIGGIGGCAAQRLEQQFRAHTSTFAYQFDDRRAPGLNHDLPGYQWGAGHAMELAYLWPSFDNGFPLYPLLDRAQRVLSRRMVRYWGAFARTGVPSVPHQTAWPSYSSGEMLSLRPDGASVALSDAAFASEHNCGFWDRAAAARAG